MWLYQMGHPTGDNTLVHVDCGTKALASVREAHRMTGNPSPPEVLRPQKRLQTVILSKTLNFSVFCFGGGNGTREHINLPRGVWTDPTGSWYMHIAQHPNKQKFTFGKALLTEEQKEKEGWIWEGRED